MDPRAMRAWALAMAWACLVWGLGGDNFSHSETSRFLGPLLRWLYPEIAPEQIAQLQTVVRKSAHVIEYGVLSILTLRALILGRSRSTAINAAFTMLLVVGLAAADETRQGFSAQRGGSHWDVLLDSSGAAAAIGVLLWSRTRWWNPLPPEDTEGLSR